MICVCMLCVYYFFSVSCCCYRFIRKLKDRLLPPTRVPLCACVSVWAWHSPFTGCKWLLCGGRGKLAYAYALHTSCWRPSYVLAAIYSHCWLQWSLAIDWFEEMHTTIGYYLAAISLGMGSRCPLILSSIIL